MSKKIILAAMILMHSIYMLGMRHPLSDQTIIELIASNIQAHRETSRYDAAELPIPFDEDVHGPIIQLKKQTYESKEYTIVNTYFGGMYLYNPNNTTWEHINAPVTAIKTNDDLISYFKEVNASSVYHSNLAIHGLDHTSYAYHIKTKMLAYPYKSTIQFITPNHSHSIYTAGIPFFTQDFFNKDGTLCAYCDGNINYNRSSDNNALRETNIELHIANITNPALPIKPISFPLLKSEHAYMLLPTRIERVFFDEKDTVHAMVFIPNQALKHTIVRPPYKAPSKHQCFIDVGIEKEELLSMGFMHDLPILYDTLLESKPILQFGSDAQNASLFHFTKYCLFNEIAPDVIRTILTLYNKVSEIPQKTLLLRYNTHQLSQRERNACKLLSECGDILKSSNGGSENALELYHQTKWTDNETWNAIQHAAKWTPNNCTYSYSILHTLWSYLHYERLSSRPKWLWCDTRNHNECYWMNNTKVSIAQENIEIKNHITKEAQYLRISFLKHRDILLNAHSYQDFVDQCKVKNVEEEADGARVIITLGGGAQLIAEKADEGCGWNREYIYPSQWPTSDEQPRPGTCVIS